MDEGASRRPLMHLLLCCNDTYLQHLFVALTSLAEQPSRYVYEVVVVMQGGDPATHDRIAREALARYEHVRVAFRRFIPDPSLVLPIRIHYTIDIFTRLWVADFFAEEVDRVLYLDSDLVIVESLDPLWETPLRDRTIGAVSIPGSTRCRLFDIPEAAGYFNSGVMLIDLGRWRKTRAFDRLMAFIQANHARLIDPDQDALNAVLHHERTPLDHIWNVITPFYLPHHDLLLGPAELERVRRQARIIHFNGASKPWSYFCRHPRRDVYWRILRLTPWRDFQPADRTMFNRMRRSIAMLIPGRLKRLLRR